MNSKIWHLAAFGVLAVGAGIGVDVANATPDKGLALSPSPNATDQLNSTQFQSDQTSADLAQLLLAQDPQEAANIQVYERVSPAVVSIDTKAANGSGTIITSDGMVLTNAHVVSEGGEVTVKLADGKEVIADVIAFGEDGLDLAVIKIRNVNNLPTVKIANPGSVKVGQRAFAIGNPFGQFQGTLTVGIISRIDQERNLLQTDAAINPGNSGGPLLNSNGELIGVNTAIFTRGRSGGNIGIGFAIAVDKIPPFLQAVKEGRAPTVARSSRPMAFTSENAKSLELDGPEIAGRLENGDPILPVDNSHYDIYAFEGKAGQQVMIEMTSREIDSYLILLDAEGGELAQDDDGGGENDAKIVVTLPQDGTYTFLANSYDAGELGGYQLRLRTAALRQQPPTSRPTPTGVLLQQQGSLDTNDAVLPMDGSLYDEYSFEGQAGQSVVIRLESQEFDPYVALFSPNGRLVAENDDVSRIDKNAAITVTLPMTGTYRVVVNAYDSTGRGQYLLTVR
ncbi:MAG: trypsin-like serine protease [Oscillatoriales cyanobacterium RM2_1_1]|nr:trypsin-like serine protease [Oscillatoriales cyanobacterium RM2_1_1]